MAYDGYFGTLGGHLGVTLGWLRGTLGWLWRRFMVTPRSCGGLVGHMEVPLGNLGLLWDYLKSLWEHRGLIFLIYEDGFGCFEFALGIL